MKTPYEVLGPPCATCLQKRTTPYGNCPSCSPEHFTGDTYDVAGNIRSFKDSLLHKEDGPAVTMKNGEEWFYTNGKLDSIVYLDGSHIDFGRHGTDYVYFDSEHKIHRKDGPAFSNAVATSWYLNGQLHREDGPAIEASNGNKSWFIHGNEVPEAHYAEWQASGKAMAPSAEATKVHDQPAIEKLIAEWKAYPAATLGVLSKRLEVLKKAGITEVSLPYKYGADTGWCNMDLDFHRTDGPAYESADGTKTWYLNGKATKTIYTNGREKSFSDDGVRSYNSYGNLDDHDGPAVVLNTGEKHHYKNGKYLSTSFPDNSSIIVEADGSISYFNGGGQYHRTNGPARKLANGEEQWYYNGQLHREGNAPARIVDGVKEYYDNGKLKKKIFADDSWMIEPAPGTQYWFDNNGSYHREGAPAIFHADGSEYWFRHGKRHRDNGPAETRPDGTKYWYENGHNFKRSNKDGSYWENTNGHLFCYNATGDFHNDIAPAILYKNGDKFWYQNGKIHRDGGPAVEHADGHKIWYQNNLIHREDGPAREGPGGNAWFLNGHMVSEEEHVFRKPTAVHLSGRTREEWQRKQEIVQDVARHLAENSDKDEAEQFFRHVKNQLIAAGASSHIAAKIGNEVIGRVDAVPTPPTVEVESSKGQWISDKDGRVVWSKTLPKTEQILQYEIKGKMVWPDPPAATNKPLNPDLETVLRPSEKFHPITPEDQEEFAKAMAVAQKEAAQFRKFIPEGFTYRDGGIAIQIPPIEERKPSERIAALYRVAATQALSLSRNSLCILLRKQGHTSEMISDFLQTDFGKSLLSVAFGAVITKTAEDDSRLAAFAKECRVQGMTIAGNSIADMVTEVIISALRQDASVGDLDTAELEGYIEEEARTA